MLGAKGEAIRLREWSRLQEGAQERQDRAKEVLIRRRIRGKQKDWYTDQLEEATRRAEEEKEASKAVA